MAEPLDDWKKKDPLAAAHLQQPVDALRRLLGRPDATAGKINFDHGQYRFEVIVGRIVDEGPADEDDFEDERYWVQPVYVSGSGGQNDAVEFSDRWPVVASDDPTPAGAKEARFAVTNLAEWPHGAHELSGGHVWVFQWFDGQDPPVRHYFMSERPSASLLRLVKIVSPASGGGKYNGKIWIPKAAGSGNVLGSGTLTEAMIGTAGADCLILNSGEVGKTTHDLAASAYLPLIFVGVLTYTNDDGTEVVTINGMQWQDCTT